MAVVRVDALCECDGCQSRFGVEIDVAEELSDYADFDAMVHEEVLRGDGVYYVWSVRGRATVDRTCLSYQPTVQGGLLLCGVCSKKCDELPIEGGLSRAQVCEALGLPKEGD